MVEIIAECATNHGGSIGRAIQFCERFAKAGANTIKFQYTRAARLSKSDPQRTWFEQAELHDRDFEDLADYCMGLRVGFLLTVYHPADVPAVAHLTSWVKVGSGEAHDTKLAEAIQDAKFQRVLVSNGIRPPNSLYRSMDAKVLACISRYPHPVCMVPAKLIETFADGWSDHSAGIEGCMAAIALGATIIEKHVQIREQSRPPSQWEATTDEVAQLRRWADLDPDRFLGRWQNG